MPFLRKLVARQEFWPLVPIGLGALLLFLRLGSYGFWEPHEIQVADRARTALEAAGASEPVADDEPGPEEETRPAAAVVPDPGAAGEPGAVGEPGMTEPPAQKKPPIRPRATKDKLGPPLTDWLVESGLRRFGQTEFGARFFLALAGLVAVVATTLMGVRLGGPLVGMLAGLVFLSFPLVILESRHLTSDIGALTGASLMGLGLVGLARPSPLGWLSPPWTYPLDILLVASGGLFAYHGAASWNGLVPPLAGIGLGALVAAMADGRAGLGKHARLFGAGAAMLAGALVIMSGVLVEVFDLVDVKDGERGLFGKTLASTTDYVASLGGAWRKEGDPGATVTAMFEQIAFGAFPWAAIAPLAVASLSLDGRTAARRFTGAALGAWAIVGWATATLYEHKVAATTYPCFTALAVVIGLWLEDLWRARSDGDAGSRPDLEPGASTFSGRGMLPIAAVFVLLCAAVIGKDLAGFPDRLTSLNLDGVTLKYPDGAKLHRALPIIGVGFGLAVAAALVLAGRLARLARAAMVAAVAIALLGAVFFADVLSPRLAARLSTKGLFAAYHELRQEGDVLGIVGNPGPGPRFYAGADFTQLRGRNELIEFLRRPQRVFALTRASELCPLHKGAASSDYRFVVVDDSNAQFLLLSNQLRAGETDQNPLSREIVRSAPADLGQALDFVFEDTIHLIGVRLPAKVERGDNIEVTLIFEVLKPITRNWKVFAHFDSGSARFQGDHDPIRGRCGTSFFQPGDFVLDTFTVKAGSMVDGTPKTTYQMYAGFFVGTNPNYTNMKVTKGQADDNNRVKAGTLRIE